jgi:hypothetical protein
MGCTLALGLLQIVAMLILHAYGIATMVKTYVVLNLVWLFVWFFFVCKDTSYTLLQMLKDIMPFALAAAGVMFATGYITSNIENLWLLLLSRCILAAVLYYAVMRLAGAQILKETTDFMMNKIKKQ